MCKQLNGSTSFERHQCIPMMVQKIAKFIGDQTTIEFQFHKIFGKNNRIDCCSKYYQFIMKVTAFVAALSASVASVGAFSAVKVGGKIPAVPMFYDFDPDAKHNMAEYTANKKVAVVGLPGAFTPTW